MKRFSLLALVALSVAGLAGCYKNPTIALPPPAPARLIVGNFMTAKVVAYSQPLSPSSQPVATITAASLVDGVAADAHGNVYVPNGNVIYVYAPPISAATVPATITVTGAVSFRGLNFDKAGNLWITDATGKQVMELTVPLGASPVSPVRTIQCVCFSFPIEVTPDIANHIFVGDNGGAVQVFNIPVATGTSVLTPVATLTSPTGSALGLASDVQDRLFVTEDVNDTIMVYNPPFATGNLPAFSISAPAFTDANGSEALVGPAQLHFGSLGNLYVAYQFDTTLSVTGGVAVFGPPFSAGSIQQFIIQGATSGMTNPVDLTFAP